jgi:HSP20 family molecular chaperone IbpA
MSQAAKPTDQAEHQAVLDATADTERTMRPQAVPVNVYETTGALVIVAPLPAVTAEDVTIERSEDGIRFYAHLRSSGQRDYLVKEWEYGGYERTVEIPPAYGGDLEATLANGQLAVRVLRGESSEVRSITPTAL